MIGFTCQRGQLKIYKCDWPPELKRRHNGRWLFSAHIYRKCGPNKCRILSGNVSKTVLKLWAEKHFGRRLTKNGLKRRFLASFLPQNGHQNLRVSICWTFAPGAFRFSLKNTKVSIIPRLHFAGNGQKYRRACVGFVGRSVSNN